MRVSVRLYATLRRYGPDSGRLPFPVELEEGATLGRLVAALGIPPNLTKLTFVNGLARPDDFPLRDGDEIGLFPPIAGGDGTNRSPCQSNLRGCG